MKKSKKETDHQYYLDNKEKIIKQTTEWNKKNRKYHREYDRVWRLKNPTKSRQSYLKRTYKFSLKEYEELKAIQAGQCGLCFKISKRLVIDHNHETGKIRSLLCTTCNAGLGQFKDSIDLLQNAIAYLKHFK